MRTYQLTETESAKWDSDDAREMDAARMETREKVRALAFKHDEMHELISADGVVLDVVYPSTTDRLASGLKRQHETVGLWLEQDAE